MQEALFSSSDETDPGEITWKDVLAEERKKEYFQNVLGFVESERKAGKTIYPANSEIFNALTLTPFSDVKVVILGQDPYHGPNQAHGLCFSVKKGIPAPPSLKNIYKELASDTGFTPPSHGYLEDWAKQGVLLLNAILTVEAGKAQSHKERGWETFSDRVIDVLNENRKGLVFLLWGSHAKKKGTRIDTSKHYVLSAVHPSPLSAHRGFLGCKHFSKANELLTRSGIEPIDWTLSE